MRNLLLIISLGLFTLPLWAQETPTIPQDGSNLSATEMVDRIVEWEKGRVFRGISFNASYESVFGKEEDQSLYEEEAPLYFTISVDLDYNLIEFADITYDFDEKGLFYITVEGYMGTVERTESMVDIMSKEYTKRFGEPALADDGFLVWQGFDRSSGYNYEVAILDFSTPSDPGFILELYALEERGADN
jgi:hypothetical protein